MIDRSTFESVIRALASRIHAIEVRDGGNPGMSTVAALPAPDSTRKGRLRFATNGRKVGEGAGVGTGTLVYDDGVAWRRVGDDTTVVA